MSSDDRLSQTRQRVDDALAEALAQADAEPDADAAYRQASWIADTLYTAGRSTSALRSRIVRRMRDADGLSLAQLASRLGVSRARVADILRDKDAEKPREPELLPVAAAIVTSPLGVLAARRNDESPLWGFISGRVEAGESPAEAAVREVREETGLEVVAGRTLGRRVHPVTQATMIYLAARPAKGAEPAGVYVGDTDELAEVRWLSLDEVDQLMPGVFEPVRAYLARDHRRQAH